MACSTRAAARKALMELQNSKSMRRALLARPRVARDFQAGDVVAYWRDQKWNQGTLSKAGRWYGSGAVLGLIGKNVVFAHRTHIIRCAPEQVRFATQEEKALLSDPQNQLPCALEWVSLILSEALDGPFDVHTCEAVLRRRPPVVVTDRKSLFDHVVSVSPPTAVEDRRTSIDISSDFASEHASDAGVGSLGSHRPHAGRFSDQKCWRSSRPFACLYQRR